MLDTPIDGSAYLHIAPPYAPEDVATLLRGQRAFAMAKGRIWSPKIVYEPSPHGCHTGQQSFLEEILPDTEVLSYVSYSRLFPAPASPPCLSADLCRPNHEELLSLYGHPLHSLSSPLLRPALEEVMKHLLDLGIGTDGSGIVAVRCGRLGSVVGTRKDGLRWIPAYWEKADEYMVKDVTGGESIGSASTSCRLAEPCHAMSLGDRRVMKSLIVTQAGTRTLVDTSPDSMLPTATPTRQRYTAPSRRRSRWNRSVCPGCALQRQWTKKTSMV